MANIDLTSTWRESARFRRRKGALKWCRARRMAILAAMPTDEALRTVVARRWRIGALLTAVMMLAYFGFILLVAFAKPFVGTLLADGRVSVGIVIGASVIALAPILTAIYVRWANRRYDPAIAALRGKK
jgi:uncharacterized membrane protein (DUF485 family)